MTELRSAVGGGATVVDVREYPEYAAGRVPGAKLMPLGQIERRSAELDHERPIYLICRTGRRSAEAQQMLCSLGFEKTVNVAGGITAWQAAGLPVERDERAPWSLERQVRFVAGSMVLAGALLSAFVAQPFLWLSAFVGAGLVFAAATDSCLMGELLAKLPWNRAYDTASHACPTDAPLARK